MTSPLTVNGKSIAVDDIGESKTLSDRFSSAHREDESLHREVGHLLLPLNVEDMEIVDDGFICI